jgi:hypothetical protein
VYNRSNWCPGEKVRVFDYEMKSMTAGNTYSLDLDMEPFTANGSASYNLATQVFFYKDYAYQNDAAIEDIMAPTKNFWYSRYNPVCDNSIIKLTNKGGAALTSAIIKYQVSNDVGIIGVCGNTVSGGSFSWVMLLCFLGLGFICIATLRFSLPTWKVLRGKPAKIFATFSEGWDEIRRTPQTTFQVIAIDVVKYLVTAWRFQIAFGLLGYHQSFWYFLVIAPAAAIAGIIAFTPGGLGIRELFVTGAAVAMGSSFDTGLLAASTDRGVMLASAVVLGGIGFLYSVPRLRRATTTQPTPTDV